MLWRVPKIGLVHLPLNEPPQVVWTEQEQDGDALLGRARSIEVETLLRLGDALWEPRGHHYRLPSGHHSANFVRVADGLRRPRDAAALSTWLHAGLKEGSVVLVDSGTIAPIISELRATAMVSGQPLSAVVSIDDYPLSQYEFRRALGFAQDAHVLAVISVSASGDMRARMERALTETAGSWRSEILVDRRGAGATAVPTTEVSGPQAAWLSLATTRLMRESECALCRDTPYIDVDPRSFAAMTIPDPTLVVPDIDDARRNRSLWERYLASGGIRLTSAKTGRSAWRPYGAPDLLFDPTKLVESSDTRDFIVNRVRQLRELPRRRVDDPLPDVLQATLAEVTGFDVVVVDNRDMEGVDDEARSRLFAALGVELGGPSVPPMVGVGPDVEPSSLRADIGTARRILIVCLGLRTGATLQRLLVQVHDAMRQAPAADPEIRAVVIHARPEHPRHWVTLRNSFSGPRGSRLVALWLSYLPNRQLLNEEGTVLNYIPGPASNAMRSRLMTSERDQTLWGPATPSLRLTSYYGDQLGASEVVAAVGSAMQHARTVARVGGSPGRVQFELPAILRSYFDPLIHVAVLRWLQPHEGWWGDRAEDAEHVLHELESRSEGTGDWDLLLPELLLAAAQAKVPPSGAAFLRLSAQRYLDDRDKSEAVQQYVRLGLRAIDSADSGVR